MNSYLGWLLLHVGAVAVSVGFFVHRGVRSLAGRPVPRRSLLGVLPHVVDSILLVSAVRLAAWIHQYPFVDAWLTAKVVALILYVVLGSIALRGTRTLIVRRWAFAAALLTLVYIVHTALTHSPRLF